MQKKFLLIVFLNCLFLVVLQKQLYAHEPLFGLGPEVIRKGKYSIEGTLEYEKKGTEKEITFESDIMYGITESFAISVEMPVVIEKQEFDEEEENIKKSAGLGKIETRVHYVFWKDYDIGKRNQAAVIAGIRLPTVGRHKDPSFGNQSMDFLAAAALGMETLTKSFFGTIEYVLNTRAYGKKEGNETSLTLAYGFRPYIADYYKRDWMFYLELDAIHTKKDETDGIKDEDSGGYVFFLGPTIFVSKENVLFKAGIQTPIAEHVNGKQDKHDLRFTISLDLHF